jgi:hypothetical protein
MPCIQVSRLKLKPLSLVTTDNYYTTDNIYNTNNATNNTNSRNINRRPHTTTIIMLTISIFGLLQSYLNHLNTTRSKTKDTSPSVDTLWRRCEWFTLHHSRTVHRATPKQPTQLPRGAKTVSLPPPPPLNQPGQTTTPGAVCILNAGLSHPLTPTCALMIRPTGTRSGWGAHI